MPFRISRSQTDPDSVGLPCQDIGKCAIWIWHATRLTLCLAQNNSGTGDGA